MLPIYIKSYNSYLKLEKDVASNTIEAYNRDIQLLSQYCAIQSPPLSIEDIKLTDLKAFIVFLHELELSSNSQARIISGIKSFFNYLELEQIVVANPSILLEAPKTSRKLPETLSVTEINNLLSSLDDTKSEYIRNRAILETMYSSGLRVSELISLKISNLFLDIGYIRVIGKGNKERLVPIGDSAAKHIHHYLRQERLGLPAKIDASDVLFINRRGGALSRVMIFYIIKEATQRAGIVKNIHPHTLRHCFATHLIEGGANLRAVQEMLGHASITTTEIYTHLSNTFLRNTLEQFHPRF